MTNINDRRNDSINDFYGYPAASRGGRFLVEGPAAFLSEAFPRNPILGTQTFLKTRNLILGTQTFLETRNPIFGTQTFFEPWNNILGTQTLLKSGKRTLGTQSFLSSPQYYYFSYSTVFLNIFFHLILYTILTILMFFLLIFFLILFLHTQTSWLGIARSKLFVKILYSASKFYSERLHIMF